MIRVLWSCEMIVDVVVVGIYWSWIKHEWFGEWIPTISRCYRRRWVEYTFQIHLSYVFVCIVEEGEGGEGEDMLLHQTLLLIPSDSDHHRLVLSASVYESRYHTMLHYRYSRFHQYSRPVDEQRVLHCMAQQQYLRPLVMEQHWMSSWYLDIIVEAISDEEEEEEEVMCNIRSGYSSLILEMSRVPMPEPVPPPSEWVSWNPWRQSHDSASLRTTSKTESTSSAPSV